MRAKWASERPPASVSNIFVNFDLKLNSACVEFNTLFKFLKLCLRSENVYSRIFLRVWFPCWGNNQDAHLDSGAEYWWDTRERLLLWKLNTVELILSIIDIRVTRSKLVCFYTSTVVYVGKSQLTPTLAAWPFCKRLRILYDLYNICLYLFICWIKSINTINKYEICVF